MQEERYSTYLNFTKPPCTFRPLLPQDNRSASDKALGRKLWTARYSQYWWGRFCLVQHPSKRHLGSWSSVFLTETGTNKSESFWSHQQPAVILCLCFVHVINRLWKTVCYSDYTWLYCKIVEGFLNCREQGEEVDDSFGAAGEISSMEGALSRRCSKSSETRRVGSITMYHPSKWPIRQLDIDLNRLSDTLTYTVIPAFLVFRLKATTSSSEESCLKLQTAEISDA